MSTYVFIDITNVHMSLKTPDVGYMWWEADWQKFYNFLCDKYRIGRVICFLWYNPKHTDIYTKLLKIGYELIHKPMIPIWSGKHKGNCDAEMVLHAVDLQSQYDHAILVTGDGDFYCLAQYLINKGKLLKIIAPRNEKASSLLKGLWSTYFMTLQDIRSKIEL